MNTNNLPRGALKIAVWLGTFVLILFLLANFVPLIAARGAGTAFAAPVDSAGSAGDLSVRAAPSYSDGFADALAATYGGVQSVLADGSGNSDSIVNGCMVDIYNEFGPGGGLACTANDVQVAFATNITILDDGCAFPGDTVTFHATFKVELAAQSRHDIGLYFALDGDPNSDGALTGQCSVSTPANAPDPPFVDLDGTGDDTVPDNAFGYCADGGGSIEIDADGFPQVCNEDADCTAGNTCQEFSGIQDTCGDMDASHDPIFADVVQITAVCRDADHDGQLDLPYCTSWRQLGANDLCLSPRAAFPGAPSRCGCDDGFGIPINVPGQIIVDKVTNPANDPTQFDFELTDVPTGTLISAWSLTDQSTPFASPGLDAGTYEVTETAKPNYSTVATCDDGSDPSAIDLQPGETVTCTFSNTLDQPEMDYGDAPESYSTSLASGGPSHFAFSSFFTGAKVDPETDGQPSLLADGDDLDILFPSLGDDEDGVTLPPVLTVGGPAAATVDGGPSGGLLDAWIDFDGSGVFDDPAERITPPPGLPLAPGPGNPVQFAVPAGALPGPTYARFRLSSLGGLPPTGGPAPDGEVEDYRVQIEAPPGTIIVEKQTIPDGAPDSFEFSTDYGPNFTLTDGGTNNSGALAPGAYTMSEINIPAGWGLTSAICDDGSDPSAIGLDPGETVVCTFTNTNIPIYVSSSTSGAAGGVFFADEDILAFEPDSGAWSMVFDGSDVGVGATDVDGFLLLSDGNILMSFDAEIDLPGAGVVDDSDIVQFFPTSLGPDTAGSFSLFFDGSDVGLSSNGEDIDAIGVSPDGRLLISTRGSFSASGVSGQNEDLLFFTATSFGSVTSGYFGLYFDGSDVDLAAKDVESSWIDPATGEIYLSVDAAFDLPGVSGDRSDVFICNPGATGPSTSCTYGPFWDGSANGYGGELTDGVSVGSSAQPVTVSDGLIYVSSSTGGNAGGIWFADEDILAYDTTTGTWVMVFDGSDVGLNGSFTMDVDGFHVRPDGSILLSVVGPSTLPDVGAVDDSDIVQFIPTSLGLTTAGTFSMYFDGSDVELTTNGEDVDGIYEMANGDLLLSTASGYTVSGARGADEDLIRFTPTSLGVTTSGSWAMYFDGSDVGLNNSTAEDVWGTWIDEATGQVYLTTLGTFSVSGVSGAGADIFICDLGTTGPDTSCTFSPFWDGSANGFDGERVDGMFIGR